MSNVKSCSIFNAYHTKAREQESSRAGKREDKERKEGKKRVKKKGKRERKDRKRAEGGGGRERGNCKGQTNAQVRQRELKNMNTKIFKTIWSQHNWSQFVISFEM